MLHTLGNLTLVTQEWNSQLSNDAYAMKRAKLATHGLLLNQEYFSALAPAAWNGQAVRGRAQWLMGKITEIWPQLNVAVSNGERRPKAVIILDDVYPVASWRDVLRRTAEMLAQWCGDAFERQVVESRRSYFSRTNTGDVWHALTNGWRVYVNANADTLREGQ